MQWTAQVVQIQFSHREDTGEDGAVWYLILGDENPQVECEHHPKRAHYYERQAFVKGKSRHRRNATPEEIAEDKANLWGWDGNTDAPTLQPSFLAQEKDKKGNVIRPYRMHSYLTGGKLVLCNDSTVVVDPSPKNCW